MDSKRLETRKKKERRGHLPGPVKALWEAREVGTRGPKPALTAEAIALAAIAVADAEGLDAVSMQRIAREVKVTTMALYRYFASKDELVNRMIELAGGPVQKWDGAQAEWRERLRQWSHGCAAIYARHGWFLQAATARRRVMGPNELEWLDTALGALSTAGLNGTEQMNAFLVLIGHVRSHAEYSAGAAKGLSSEQWARITTELVQKHRERYDAVLRAIEAGAFAAPRGDGFAFGLECILEGIEALAARKKRSSRKRSQC
jgi:AcrR family transcriptional regulator